MIKILDTVADTLESRGEYTLAKVVDECCARIPSKMNRTRIRETERELRTLKNQYEDASDELKESLTIQIENLEDFLSRVGPQVTKPNVITPPSGISRSNPIST